MAFRGKRWREIGALIDRLADLRLRSKKVYSASLVELESLPPDTLSQWAILARESKEAQAKLDGLQVNIQDDFRAQLEIIRRISWLQEFIGGAILLVVLATAFFGTRAFIEMAAQKRANEAMREAHKQNEVVLNSVPSLLIELGPDGYIRRWNRSATTILGWDEKVVRGQPLSSCGIDWLTPGMQEKVAACLQSPAENALGEARFKKDGETRFLGLNAVRLKDKAGDSVGTLVVGADITKRTILEGQLRQAQKLEAIGQLAAGIAHEINTPTQYVGDNTNFLKESWPAIAGLARAAQHVQQEFQKGDLPAEAMDHLSACIQEADLDYLLDEIPRAIDQAIEGMQRVAKIVHAMKEFSHPGSEGKSSLDINRAIETTIAVARNEWKYVCEVETHLDRDLPLVAGHGPEFNQVILNLLVNAAHAIRHVVGSSPEQKGKITITTTHDQSEAEIAIADSGGGIPKEIQSRIFEPFFTTKPVGQGTGQGLALAHTTIVRRHSGRLWFETVEGKGTTFYIRLPISSVAEPL
jgi:PAS domain S-box-containing protein